MKLIPLAGCMLGVGILSSTLTVLALRLVEDPSRRAAPVAAAPVRTPAIAAPATALPAPEAAAPATGAETPAAPAVATDAAAAQPVAENLPPPAADQPAALPSAAPPAPQYQQQPAPSPTIVYQPAPPTIIYEPAPVVINETNEVTYVIYREYFGCSAEEAYLIPQYRRYYGIGDDDLFVIYFVACHAHVPFELAFRDFRERCGGRHAEFIALYRIDPLLFFTPLDPGERCPPAYQRSYDWYFHHHGESHAFTADEFRALVALKIATEYQAQSPATFFSLALRYGTPSAVLVQERDRCGNGHSWSGERIDQPVERPWHLRPAEHRDWETRFATASMEHEKTFRHEHPEVMARPAPAGHVTSPVTVAPRRDGGEAIQHPHPATPPAPTLVTARPEPSHVERPPERTEQPPVRIEQPPVRTGRPVGQVIVEEPAPVPTPREEQPVARPGHTDRDRSEDARRQPVETRPANADPGQIMRNGGSFDNRPQPKQSTAADPAQIMRNGGSTAPEHERTEEPRFRQPDRNVDTRPQAPVAPRQSTNADPGQIMRNGGSTAPTSNGNGRGDRGAQNGP